MAVSSHVQSLSSKHSELDNLIKAEMRSPSPDTLRIATLKKQKLALKDEMSHLKVRTA